MDSGMTLARLARKINKMKSDLSELDNRIEDCVSCLEGNEFKDDLHALLRKRGQLVDSLLQAKCTRMAKNIEHDKYKDILRLAEFKAELALFKGLHIKEGAEIPRFSNTDQPVIYKSQISNKERQDWISDLKVGIEKLLDELDVFNAKTRVGEDESDEEKASYVK
jgi:hypothetical protein